MTCTKIYRLFDWAGVPRDFHGCHELRAHYALLDDKANPSHIVELRTLLEDCPKCNEDRKELLQKYNPDRLRKDYQSPWLTDKH